MSLDREPLTADSEIGNVKRLAFHLAGKSMDCRRHPNLMRRAATIAALILLLSQAIAAAHVHWNLAQRQFSENSATGIADGSCAICAAHFHSPGNRAAVIPALKAPTTVEFVVAAAQLSAPPSTRIANRFGQAPPASF